jgi:hypothetical protein
MRRTKGVIALDQLSRELPDMVSELEALSSANRRQITSSRWPASPRSSLAWSPAIPPPSRQG